MLVMLVSLGLKSATFKLKAKYLDVVSLQHGLNQNMHHCLSTIKRKIWDD